MSSTRSGWMPKVAVRSCSPSGLGSPISTHMVRFAACASRMAAALSVRSTRPSTMMCANMGPRGYSPTPAGSRSKVARGLLALLRLVRAGRGLGLGGGLLLVLVGRVLLLLAVFRLRGLVAHGEPRLGLGSCVGKRR